MRRTVYLRAGDVVLTASDSLISRAIRRFTRLPGEPPTRYSHCEIVVAGGPLEVAEVVSADMAGIRQRTITPFHRGKGCLVYRPTVPLNDRGLAAMKAQTLRGRKYPVWRLLMHLLDRLLGGAFFFRRFGRSPYNPECAALVALVYRHAITFSSSPWWAVAPDDIDDHSMACGYARIFDGVLP